MGQYRAARRRLPFIVTGLRLAVGRGLIGMVLADLYTAISGIGYLIVRTASTYRVDRMFVPIVDARAVRCCADGALAGRRAWIAPWTAAGEADDELRTEAATDGVTRRR